jgi:uncharacterized protein
VNEASIEFAVFCKAPIAGRVKTRLIPAFGAEKSAELYRSMLLKTLVTVDDARRALGASASLWVADDTDDESLVEYSQRLQMPRFVQCGSDLGERMHHCLLTTQQRAHRVVLIGSDCPAFTSAHLIHAANVLTPQRPWVFTPAEDGGYVLVGTCDVNDVPFREMRWSEASVMSETRTRLSNESIAWSEMSVLWDVDTESDVIRAQQLGWL